MKQDNVIPFPSKETRKPIAYELCIAGTKHFIAIIPFASLMHLRDRKLSATKAQRFLSGLFKEVSLEELPDEYVFQCTVTADRITTEEKTYFHQIISLFLTDQINPIV